MMSPYSTGEAAKRCGVSVRTIQYYDQRGIVSPQEETPGGRRLYSEEELQTLQIVCFLRSLGLSLSTIQRLLQDSHSEAIISLLLQEQIQAIEEELKQKKGQLHSLKQLMTACKSFSSLSIQALGDITIRMKTQKKLRHLHLFLLLVGIGMDILLLGSLFVWIKIGLWLPFAVCFPIVLALGIWLTRTYYFRTAYLCPQCHHIFRPSWKAFLFSSHTPQTRQLTCRYCGHKGFCVELYQPKVD